MTQKLTPLQVCERLIGPPAEVARAAGYTAKAAYGWRLASSRNSSRRREAGHLPPRAMRALLLHSDAHDLGLTARHLIIGATEAEVAAILQARGPREEAA